MSDEKIDYSHCPDVQVWDSDMEIITSISPEVYTYLRFERNLRTYDTFEFHINKNHPKAAYLLQDDALCIVFNDGKITRAGIIEQCNCSMGENGMSDEDLIVSGRSGGMLGSRVTLRNTSTGTGYDTVTNVSAEEAMKHYVDVNCVNAVDGNNATATNRVIPNFEVAAVSTNPKGNLVTYSTRFKVLSDVLNSLSYSGGVGWEITFDWTRKKFIFDVISGDDHTELGGDPVVFRPKLNNVKSMDYTYSRLGTSSLAYVGGQGEDSSRTIEKVYLETTEPSGWDRREVFVDQRNTDDESELITSGKSELEENSGEITISAELNISSIAQQYQTDYNLGDYVTVNYEGIASLDVPIISIVDEVVGGTRGGVRNIKLEFGTEPSDIRRMVKKSMMKKGDELK